MRGCGTRAHGALYFESATCDPGDPRCKPIDYFLLDPPWPIDRETMLIPDRGVALIDRPDGSGIVDVWDYVGDGAYPNAADVIEEGRMMGISRRAPKSTDYSRLTRQSRLILIHAKAIAKAPGEAYDALAAEEHAYGARQTAPWRCPRNVIEHSAENIWPPEGRVGNDEMCAALWYETVEGGEFAANPRAPARTVERTIGSTCYTARRWFERGDPITAWPVEWEPGAFLMVPIGNFTAILEADGSPPVEAIRAAARSALPISLAKE